MLLERCGPCVPEKAGTAEGETVTVNAKSRHLAHQRHYYRQRGTRPLTPKSRPGHHGQSLHSPLSSRGKGCVAAEFPAAPAGSCSCTTHHPKRVFKGLHYVLGFFLRHRQWSLPIFLSARFLRGQTKAITSNHDYAVPSGHLPGTTTGRINFLN